MYSSERENRVRKNPNNPSFSSSLLDEIYRSIDDGDQKHQESKLISREKTMKKHTVNAGGGVREKTSNIEKWMEKDVINHKVTSRLRDSSLPEFDRKALRDINDRLFFSSSSCCSDSSYGGFSSSETESFALSKSKTSCLKPKQIRTSVPSKKLENLSASHEHSDFYFFDDYQNQMKNKVEDSLIYSKSRALKIYANLKKVKQPISPGGRLTSFINSLFTNGNTKKTKNSGKGGGHHEDFTVARKKVYADDMLIIANNKHELPIESIQSSSACSSASSFSRSCLSKVSPNSREKRKNGNTRTVRFCPVSIIVDEDSRPCGHKSIYDEGFEKFRTSTLPKSFADKNRKAEEVRSGGFKGYENHKKNVSIMVRNEGSDEDYNDAASDCSSDLFELDHLAMFGNNRFCEELPVYETTRLDRNRAIAGGLIR